MMADGNTDARVTIRTVAADAGVSVAAVSKVMRNAYGVSDALRLKVEASIEKLGYRPSVAARGMRGRTFTLGVLLVGIDNPFLPGIYQGIESVTESAGYKIMVGVGAARARTEAQLIEQMIDNRMDGMILVASQIAGGTLEHYARQIPIVVVGHHEAITDSPMKYGPCVEYTISLLFRYGPAADHRDNTQLDEITLNCSSVFLRHNRRRGRRRGPFSVIRHLGYRPVWHSSSRYRLRGALVIAR